MPEPEYVWLPREDILHFEEIERLVDIFTTLGVDKIRLPGGEPLLRRDVPELVHRLGDREHVAGRGVVVVDRRGHGQGRRGGREDRETQKRGNA